MHQAREQPVALVVDPLRVGAQHWEQVGFNQGIGAEIMAERWGLSRQLLDEFSADSHARLATALDDGRLVDQIVPITLADGTVVTQDEGVRRGTTADSLSGLRTVFKADGVIHAGNSSQISDGAAALLMTTSERAAELGLRPLARVHTTVLAGDDPQRGGMANATILELV